MRREGLLRQVTGRGRGQCPDPNRHCRRAGLPPADQYARADRRATHGGPVGPDNCSDQRTDVRAPASDVPTLKRDPKLAVKTVETVYLFNIEFDFRDQTPQVSAKDGTFKIGNVPPGKYVVEAYHRKAGKLTKEITVGDQTQTADFAFTVPSK